MLKISCVLQCVFIKDTSNIYSAENSIIIILLPLLVKFIGAYDLGL